MVNRLGLSSLLGLTLGFLLGLLSRASAAGLSNSTCPVLASQIAAITERPEFQQARWGILAQTLDPRPRTLYAQDEEKFFIPASNVKLLTTAAALTQLGSEFHIRTSVYQLPNPSGQVILRVVGRGDPSFSEAQLQALVEQIRNQGIGHIHQLIVDDRYFQGDAVNSTWEWEDIQSGYGAPVNSLILNQNAINLTLIPQRLGQPLRIDWDDQNMGNQWQIVNRSHTVATETAEFVQVGRDLSQPILYVEGQLRAGSASEPVAISVPQPTQHFLQQLLNRLNLANIQVDQTALAPDALATATKNLKEIAGIDSPRLAELITTTNQQSNNLYAESLIRQLGANPVDPHNPHTLKLGIANLEANLAKLGIDPSLYALADGSGLSRHNSASPTAIVKTLQAMATSPKAETYRRSLSTAGVNGTLISRFQDTPVQGRFYGKTGALTHTVALSGYLEPPDRSPMAVSILVNQANFPIGTVQSAVDALVNVLFQGSC